MLAIHKLRMYSALVPQMVAHYMPEVFFSCKLKLIHFQTQYLGMSLICILASGTAILPAKKLLKLSLRNSCTMQVIFILKKN